MSLLENNKRTSSIVSPCNLFPFSHMNEPNQCMHSTFSIFISFSLPLGSRWNSVRKQTFYIFYVKLLTPQTTTNEKFSKQFIIHAMLHPCAHTLQKTFTNCFMNWKTETLCSMCVCVYVWLNLNNVTLYLVHYLFSWQHKHILVLKRYGLMMKYELQKSWVWDETTCGGAFM